MQRFTLFVSAVVFGMAAPAFSAPTESREAAQSLSLDEQIRRATVLVRMKMAAGEGFGTGVVLNRTGLVLTNNHVIDPSHGKSSEQRGQIEHSIGRPEHSVVLDIATPRMATYTANIIYQSEPCDVALLQLVDKDGKPPQTSYYLTFLPDEWLETSMKIKIIGFPGGVRGKPVPPVVTRGLTTELRRTTNGAISYIETDATVHPGNSGGPVVDMAGLLIGIAARVQLIEGEKNHSGVVPGHLIKTFITSAFRQGRIPKDTDIIPFVDLFLNENDVVELPVYPRDPAAITIHSRDGTIKKSELTAARLTLPTPWGSFEVPADRVAYILTEGDTGIAIMDGGDRLSFNASALSLPIKTNGRAEQLKITSASVLAFANKPRPVTLLPGEGVILEGQGCRIGLAEVKGEIGVQGANYALDKLTIIESDPGGTRTVETDDGQRLRGKLAEAPISARTAWSPQPIQIRPALLKQVSIHLVDWPYVHAAGKRLADRLDIEDEDIEEIADLLESPDWKEARAIFEELKNKKGLSSEDRKQLQLLLGVEMMRNGDFEGARTVFKRYAPRDPVGWVAQGYLKILDSYPDGTYQGQKLSEPDTLWRASTGAARMILYDAYEQLTRLEKKEDAAAAKALQDLEKQLDIADRLQLGIAQSALSQVLIKQFHVQIAQLQELQKTYNEAVDELRSKTSRRGFNQSVNKLKSLEARGKMMVKEAERIRDRIIADSGGFTVEAPEFKEAPPE